MNVVTLALAMLVIFLLMLLGYFAYKRGIVTEPAVKGISGLVSNFCGPAMALNAAVANETPIAPAAFGGAFALCAAVYGILILAGMLINLLLRVRREERYSYQLPTVFGNVGFIGYPVCLAVLGQESLIYVTISVLLFNLLVYTYGKQMLAKAAHAGAETGGLAARLKLLVNPGTVSSVLALIIYLSHPRVPGFIGDVLSYTAGATVFLSMLVLGCSLAASPLKKLLLDGKRVYLYLAIRMLALPIAVVLILKLFVHDPLLLGTMAVLVSLPGGTLPLMLCKELDLEAGELSRAIILSTVICVFTIPVVCLFL